MRLSITLFLTMCAFAGLRAQERTFYYTDGGYRVSTRDSADYYRVYKQQPDGLYSFNQYDADGDSLQARGTCRIPDSASLQGAYTFYRSGGRVAYEGNYDNNKRTGLWRYYYKNGNVHYTEILRDGRPVDSLLSYYESGKLKRKQYFEHGMVTGGKRWDENGNEIKFTAFEEMPRPEYNLTSYLGNNIRYPEKCRRKGIEGRVLITFEVSTDGSIIGAKVIRGVSDEIDKEALRVINDMANWRPGMQDDVPVRVKYTQPISFKLE